MRLVLDGKTAYEFWMSASIISLWRILGSSQQTLSELEQFSSREISQIISRCDGAPGRLHVLVGEMSARRSTKYLKCHTWTNKSALPPGSLYAIGKDLYVESPELCLLRLAVVLSRLELLHALSNMLGTFAFSISDRTTLINRGPITNIDTIRRYLQQIPGARGGKTLKAALAWVEEGSASPRETSMNLCLRMPTRVGGQGLPHFEANAPFTLSDNARTLTTRGFLVPDVLWREKKLALEYNSSKHHDTEEELEMDMEKITAMQHMKVTVVPITTRQFDDFDAFNVLVQGVRPVLGVRNYADEAAVLRRRSTHAELLRIERARRQDCALLDTARWQYLLPRMYVDEGEV